MPPLRVRARWVLPVIAPPIEQGAVLIGEDGRIVAVGPDREVPPPPVGEAWDLGDAALLPGLVNTHTHLELTALRGLIRDLPFVEWIAAIKTAKDALSAEQFRASARLGVLESFAAGITTIGDTGSSGAGTQAMAELGARGIAYHEVFGPDPAQCDAAIDALERTLERLWPYESQRVVVGISPHAPYTVSAELLRAIVLFARAEGKKVAMHLAESPEESALVEAGSGPFADRLRQRGIAVQEAQGSPVAWAARAGFFELKPLAIHCVTAGEEDVRFMARHGATVAHCPWSNAALGHGRADLAAMRRAGLIVGLGTDSVATGGRLDLFGEARLAALGVPLATREMLRLVTADAAAALGVAGAGALAPGAWGDLTAVSFAPPALAASADPEEAVARCATPSDVVFTAVAGRVVYKRSYWPAVNIAVELDAARAASAAARAALARGMNESRAAT